MTSPKALGEKNGQIMKVVTIEIETGNEGQRWLTYFCVIYKVEKISEDSLDSIPSPSGKIHIIAGKTYLW